MGSARWTVNKEMALTWIRKLEPKFECDPERVTVEQASMKALRAQMKQSGYNMQSLSGNHIILATKHNRFYDNETILVDLGDIRVRFERGGHA